MMQIYTGTGDTGETGLGDGSRLPKDSIRIESYGTIDELNASIGFLVQTMPESEQVLRAELTTIQQDLLCLGARLANPSGGGSLPPMPVARIALFEAFIDRMTEELPPLDGFILPGGCASAARAHLARTICRKAERRVVSLARAEPESGDVAAVLQYLNRLSDYLFTVARHCNVAESHSEQGWLP